MFATARLLTGLLLLLAGCTASPRRAFKSPPPDYPPAPPSATNRVPTAPVSQVPSATPITNPALSWFSLARWASEMGFTPPYFLAATPLSTYGITTPRGVAVFQVGSRSASWDGLEIRLGFAPQLIGGQVWLHSLDLRKNVEPLLKGFAGLAAESPRRIVIDPGHGGANSGARSVFNGGWEKDYTLDTALRLGTFLAARGWQVDLTRTNDTDMSLTNRVAIANARGADLFLSLHFNSMGGNTNGTDQAGLETYCLTPTGMPSNLTRDYPDDESLALPNNAFDERNIQLALHLHRAVLNATGQTDRGVRRARFMTVLQGARCPAVLIEGGYLSNPSEARRIADGSFRQLLAGAIAEALK